MSVSVVTGSGLYCNYSSTNGQQFSTAVVVSGSVVNCFFGHVFLTTNTENVNNIIVGKCFNTAKHAILVPTLDNQWNLLLSVW
jgi:hypothetical protein